MRKIWLYTIAALLLSTSAFASDEEPRTTDLERAIASPTRTSEFIARDDHRHPLDELRFFGLTSDMTVIEIWPGKGYWTEILAPYLHDYGTYYVALPPEEPNTAITKLLSDDDIYANVRATEFDADAGDLSCLAPVDAIVTFRNLHNWLKAGKADIAFQDFFRALKPGGLLGIEDHRGLSNVPQETQTSDGYVQEQFAIDLAEKAGFEFVASSPLNNNPRDTKVWPKGVWTLPPTLALGDTDRAMYEEVGEADNFVLLFRKPTP